MVAVDVGENLLLPGVANLGRRPTFGGEEIAVEVHILDGERHLYGHRVRVLFFTFLRPEQKFASVEELTAAIRRDVESARAYFEGAALRRRMYY